jgi:hypothetical protein
MSSQREGGITSKPFVLSQYLQLNDAIEQFTADMVAHDPKVFRSGRSDIRYVIERYLYFALVADRKLYDYFVAVETGAALPDVNDLSIWGRQIAPYFRDARPTFEPQNWRSRCLRYLHQLHSRSGVQVEGCDDGRPRILFLVLHPKFVRYLKPIADTLCLPYAFLTIDHTEMFCHLAEQGLPRVHIQMNVEWEGFTKLANRMVGFELRLGLFDGWILKLNALKRVLGTTSPSCIVVPEGNADIYELVNQAAKAAGVPTLCVQQGWAPVVHTGFRNMSYDRMCVWGQKFADLLSPYNPQERFVVTGNHMIASASQGDISKRSTVAFFLQNGAHWITQRAWCSMLELIEWASKEFPENEIRVREHPGAPLQPADELRLKALPNVRLMSPVTSPLVDVLSGCRVAVAMNSTVILEAVASGIVPLILDVAGFGPYHPDIASDKAAIEVTSFCAARRGITRLMQDDAYCASFAQPLDDVRKGLFLKNGDEALQAIATEIRDLSGLRPSAV